MADKKDLDIEQQITDLQKERNEWYKQELANQEKINKLKNKYVSELDLEIERRAKVQELDEKYVDTLSSSQEAIDERLQSLKDELAAGTKKLENGEAGAKLSAKENKALEDKIKSLDDISKLDDKAREELAKRIGLRVQENKEFAKTVAHATKFGSRVEGLLGLGMEFGDTWIGGLAHSGKLMLDLAANSKNLGKSLASSLMAQGPKLLGLVATRTEELLTATDNMISGFVKATGGNEEFRDSLVNSMNASRKMGLSIETAGAATQALYESTVSFREASAQGRESMILFTAILDQAGVSSQQTARNVQILSKTLNIAGEDAMTEVSKLVTLAQSISRPIAQVSADFAESASVISAHGDGMMQVFAELSAAAQATGLSMGQLLTIAGQFDTFDSAASAVGRLNSIMGGPYLNSIEMVYMSESERIRAMLEATELSGASWQSMGRLEKRAFAAAAGITDMAQANELFGDGLAAYDEAQAKADLNAASQKEMAKLAKESTTMLENLRNSLNGIAVSLAPVIKGFRLMIDALTWVLNLGSSFLPLGAGFVSWAITLGGALKGLHFVWKLMNLEIFKSIGLKIKDLVLGGKDIALKGVRYMMDVVGLNTGYQLNLMKKRSILYGLKLIAIKLKDIAVDKLSALSSLWLIAIKWKNIAVDKVSALWAGITTSAIGIKTAAIWATVTATLANIAAATIQIAKYVLFAAALVFILPIIVGLVAIYAVWTAAQWALNVAMTANPVGMIVVGVGLLIAAVVGLIVYWDEVTAAFGTGIDWISNKFSGMIDFLKNMGNSFGALMLGLLDIWLFPMRLMINSLIGGINLLIKGMNLIPGVDIPTIGFVPTVTEMAGMQEGGTLTQGSAIVGEPAGGPELLTKTSAGPKITPLPGGGKGTNSGANLVAALNENTATMKALMAASGKGGGGDRPAEIVVNMNHQQLRLAAKILNGAINTLPEKDLSLRYDLGGVR